MARCHHRLGNLEEAAVNYEKFLAAAPAHEGAPRARASLLEVLGALGARRLDHDDAAGARAAFARAIELLPAPGAADAGETAGSLYAGLGLALARLGRRAEATAALEKALVAPLAPATRARVEAALAAVRPPSTAPSPATAPAVSLAVDAPPSPPPLAPRRRSGSGLWLGVGIGAATLAAAGAAAALLFWRATRPDLGWHAVDWVRTP